MTGFLDELQATVAAVSERVGPAVVGLGRGWGRGSGVVIAEGRVLTNAHVLRGDEIAVRRPDGEVALGRVSGLDADLDVAVLSVDTGGAPAVAWDPAAVDDVRPGLPVFALAPPRAARRLRAAVGLPEREGLLVRGVEPDSPAAAAGLEPGDLLVAAGDTPLRGYDALFDALEAGGSLRLTVVRGTEERQVTAHFT